MGKKVKFARKDFKQKRMMIRILVSLSIALIIEICFAVRIEGATKNTRNTSQKSMEVLQSTERTISQSVPNEITQKPEQVEPDMIPSENMSESEPIDQDVNPTESTHGSEPIEMNFVSIDETTRQEEIGLSTASIDEMNSVETEQTIEPVIESISLGQEDKDMLLRIAMAEVGCADCVECAALVMRTVLNRVKSPGFANSICGVLHTENQFSPVESGSFDKAIPNEICYDALDLILNGWDESQGALYFEACIGSSWHSRNLELLFQHCSTRFYK